MNCIGSTSTNSQRTTTLIIYRKRQGEVGVFKDLLRYFTASLSGSHGVQDGKQLLILACRELRKPSPSSHDEEIPIHRLGRRRARRAHCARMGQERANDPAGRNRVSSLPAAPVTIVAACRHAALLRR